MEAPLDEAQVETVEDPLMGEPGDPDPDLSQVRGRRQFANQPQGHQTQEDLGNFGYAVSGSYRVSSLFSIYVLCSA